MCIWDGDFPNGNLRTYCSQELSEGKRYKRAPVVSSRELCLSADAEYWECWRAKYHDRQELHHCHCHGIRKIRQNQLAHHVASWASGVPRHAQRHHHQRLPPCFIATDIHNTHCHWFSNLTLNTSWSLTQTFWFSIYSYDHEIITNC